MLRANVRAATLLAGLFVSLGVYAQQRQATAAEAGGYSVLPGFGESTTAGGHPARSGQFF